MNVKVCRSTTLGARAVLTDAVAILRRTEGRAHLSCG
jgi:hypothetical protein